VAMANLVRTCANYRPGSEPSMLSASGALLDDQPAPGQLNTDCLTFGFLRDTFGLCGRRSDSNRAFVDEKGNPSLRGTKLERTAQ
jgi:hypothetical protein